MEMSTHYQNQQTLTADLLGFSEGLILGSRLLLGASEGVSLGASDGVGLGNSDGLALGSSDKDGETVGLNVGKNDGGAVGDDVGAS